jgi:heme/copper-type cytochrome/quinol oxidase subunit 4
MLALAVMLSSSAEDSGGVGFLLIAATILAVVVVIGAIWTFAARRGSRMPEREAHRHDQGVRGS